MERKFKITVEGRQYSVTVEEVGQANHGAHAEAVFPRTLTPLQPVVAQAPTHAAIAVAADPGDVVSTLGGVVESLLAKVDQDVKMGENLLIVEAMKMKTAITAHRSGKVAEVLVQVGDGVQAGQVLMKIA